MEREFTVGAMVNSYTGYWKNNKMNGQGKMEWNDGKIYEGKFIDDKREGLGYLLWPDGRKYEGEWHNR